VLITHPRTENGLRVVLVTRGCERWNRILDHTIWDCGQHYSGLRIEFNGGESWRQLRPRRGLLPDDDDDDDNDDDDDDDNANYSYSPSGYNQLPLTLQCVSQPPVTVLDFIFIPKIKKTKIYYGAYFHLSIKQNVGDEDFPEWLT